MKKWNCFLKGNQLSDAWIPNIFQWVYYLPDYSKYIYVPYIWTYYLIFKF